MLKSEMHVLEASSQSLDVDEKRWMEKKKRNILPLQYDKG